MIYTFLLTLLVIDCIVVMLAILLQSGKGSGLAASFGGASSSPDALIEMRQAENIRTTISWWGGGILLGLCLILHSSCTRTSAQRWVLEKSIRTPHVTAQTATTPAPEEPTT